MNKYSELQDQTNKFIEPKKSGFFDLDSHEYCDHPEHNPPQHLHIPQGKGYKHVCPRCGKTHIIIPQQISF